MSRLEELIEQLCPNGVEYKAIGDVTFIKRGDRITKKDLVENGTFKVASGGVEPMGYYDKFNREANTITISSYGYAGYVNYIEERFWANDVCLCVYPCGLLNNKYLYYVLKNTEAYFFTKTTKAIPDHIPTEIILTTSIPVPPLDIQNEIVKILDSFTELTAELKDRKKQYEWYRNELLSIGKEIVLSDVALYVKERVDASTLTAETYVGVDNLLQNKAGKTKSEYVPTSGKVAGYQSGDVLIGNIRPYLKKIWLSDCNGGTNGDVLVIRSKDKNRIIPQFLYHVLSSDFFFNYDTNNSKGAKMPRGDKDAVMRYVFSLPSKEEQQRIVDILDRFDALCNDISSGLPAEIEARQKQYEYYRDKLLTFKPLT